MNNTLKMVLHELNDPPEGDRARISTRRHDVSCRVMRHNTLGLSRILRHRRLGCRGIRDISAEDVADSATKSSGCRGIRDV
ncbi:MAG: hypothetical protein H6852_03870 [Geminicoccaceae bacterium]|jgi:hypothetical protein|nr:hypothetical protein [Geminicoccaceae bacterium]MCB9966764.1 hypothetical protein [Geminicoccaceae bacterium]HRY26873.1 hypothetical protein [Geminicoccaceae bacterium]